MLLWFMKFFLPPEKFEKIAFWTQNSKLCENLILNFFKRKTRFSAQRSANIGIIINKSNYEWYQILQPSSVALVLIYVHTSQARDFYLTWPCWSLLQLLQHCRMVARWCIFKIKIPFWVSLGGRYLQLEVGRAWAWAWAFYYIRP
jgi:hypothetical protein